MLPLLSVVVFMAAGSAIAHTPNELPMNFYDPVMPTTTEDWCSQITVQTPNPALGQNALEAWQEAGFYDWNYFKWCVYATENPVFWTVQVVSTDLVEKRNEYDFDITATMDSPWPDATDPAETSGFSRTTISDLLSGFSETNTAKTSSSPQTAKQSPACEETVVTSPTTASVPAQLTPHLPWVGNWSQIAQATGTGSLSLSPQATVVVGDAGKLIFSPSSLDAAIGSTIAFNFLGPNHTLTQSDLLHPCQHNGSFDTGFRQFNPTNASGKFIVEYMVTDALPKWFFCDQKVNGSHCHAGIVFSLNPGGAQSQFLSNAIAGTGTLPSTTGNKYLTSALFLLLLSS